MPRRGHDGGFTLVELMLAVAITSVVAAAMASLLTQGIRLHKRHDRDDRQRAVSAEVLTTLGDRLQAVAPDSNRSFQGSATSVRFTAWRRVWSEAGDQVIGARRERVHVGIGNEGRHLWWTSTGIVTDPAVEAAAPDTHVVDLEGAAIRLAYAGAPRGITEVIWDSVWTKDRPPRLVKIECTPPDGGPRAAWRRVLALPCLGGGDDEEES